MQTHGNLTASYLWQPGELARRMLGERPSPVPPTRDIWPTPHQPLSISTLHVAYLQDEPAPRRAATLPPQPYVPTTIPLEHEHSRPRVCTVGTNTDPPLTVLGRLRRLIRKDEDGPIGQPPPGRLTAIPRETALDVKEEENAAKRAYSGIKKAISGAKYRIAPGTETVGSPKIVYDMPKPGDRMTTTFGVREPRKWFSMPSAATCSRRIRSVGGWCRPRPQRPPRRQPQPRLQITQV
ncbi:uncharacterized protein LOC106132122 [Amyelois transitella]|uniref:uncharacterized protein LOC106132122 n=1 Tax=Amyelois transitella TaxID=680683 RepID=UPI00067C63C4|nr:uncharacterized protein LOC106132122 [Amyelois transitella]